MLAFLALFLSAAQAAPAAAAVEPVALFVGDSLTAGFGIPLESAFPALLEERWRKEGSRWRARNAGVSGATTAGVLETLDWTLTKDVKLVFLCAGANDGLRGLDLKATRANLERITAAIQAKGIPVALAGMRIPPNYGADYARRFAAMYREVAAARKVPLMPFLLEGVAGRKELNLPDGIHPNEEGHRRMAEAVQAFLAKERLLE